MKPKKGIYIITGHYGCGKTSFALNFALNCTQAGVPTAIVDLDIVNPYFRTSDQTELLKQRGVEVIAPNFAGSNLDVPSLPASIPHYLRNFDGVVILDVGGDDAGAIALGQYAATLQETGYEMYYVFNCYRVFTAQVSDAAEILRDIEAASRLKATGLINNSNLGEQTTVQHIANSSDYARQLSELTGLPLVYTSYHRPLHPPVEHGFPMEQYIVSY